MNEASATKPHVSYNRGIRDGQVVTCTVYHLLVAARGRGPVQGQIPKVAVYTVCEWDRDATEFRALYVGATCNGVERRLARHLSDQTPLGRLIRSQGLRARRWTVFMQACAPEDVYELERAEIRDCAPLLNQREG